VAEDDEDSGDVANLAKIWPRTRSNSLMGTRQGGIRVLGAQA